MLVNSSKELLPFIRSCGILKKDRFYKGGFRMKLLKTFILAVLEFTLIGSSPVWMRAAGTKDKATTMSDLKDHGESVVHKERLVGRLGFIARTRRVLVVVPELLSITSFGMNSHTVSFINLHGGLLLRYGKKQN